MRVNDAQPYTVDAVRSRFKLAIFTSNGGAEALGRKAAIIVDCVLTESVQIEGS